ncbi:MAG: LamG-like jellyroll fold domain-containing protein [Bacteroidia bacterium]
MSVSSVVTPETCPGFYDGSIDLTVSGANGIVTFTWSNGATSEDVGTLTAGTYSVIVVDQMGCTVYDTIVVGDSYVFTIDLGPDTTVCDLSHYELQANAPGATFYLWDNGSTDSSITVNGPGLFSCFAQDALGCYDDDSVYLYQFPQVVAAIATSHPGCSTATGELDLTVVSGTQPYSYLWSTSATSEDIGNLPVGSYSVVVTDSNGCTEEISALVIGATNLSAYAISDTLVCSSHNVQFQPYQYGVEFDGTDDYLEVPDAPAIQPTSRWTLAMWVMPTSASGAPEVVAEKRQANENGYSIRYDPNSRMILVRLQNGPFLTTFTAPLILNLYQWTHIALVVDSTEVRFYMNGTVTNEIVYNGGVDPTLGTPLRIGGGPNRLTFDGRVDEVVLWDFALNPSQVGEFSKKALPQNQQFVNLNLSFNEAPGFATASDFSANGLDASFINMDTVASWFSSNPMGHNFLWDFGDLTVSSGQAPYHGYLPRVWQTMLTQLQVTSDLGCTTTDTVMLPVHTPAVPFIVTDTNAAYCIGDTLMLWMQSGYASYLWSTGSTNDSIMVLSSGQYSVTADDGQGCVHSGTLPINYSPNTTPNPIVIPSGSLLMCNGDSILLDVGAGYSYYLWSTGETTQTIYASDSGTYFVTVRNGFGCERTSASLHIAYMSSPVATITPSGNILSASTGVAYQWYLNGVAIVGAINQQYIPLQNGVYTVLVTGPIGCSDLSAPYTFVVGVQSGFEGGDAQLFPNPTSGASQVRVVSEQAFTATVRVTDLLGRVMYEAPVRIPASEMLLDLPTDQFEAGTYLVTLTGSGRHWCTRLVKQ